MKAIIVLCVLLLATSADAGRLRPEHDLQYLGAFKVPYVDSTYSYIWAYTGAHSFVYNPATGNLISPAMVVGGGSFGKVTEISIPTPVVSPTHDLSEIPSASMVQPWTDLTEGKSAIGLGQAFVGGMAILPAQGTQNSSKIYWLTTDWYGDDGPYTNTEVPTVGMSNINWTIPSALGTWIPRDVNLGAVSLTRTSRYMTNIPDAWSSAHAPGYKLAIGENKINNGGALGACLYAMQPWTTDTPPAAGNYINLKVLFCPGGDDDTAHSRNYDGSLFDDYSWVDSFNAPTWVSVGTRSAIIYTGIVGTLTAPDYGDCDADTENCQYYKNSLPGDADQVINPTLGCNAGVCDSSPDFTGNSGDVKGEPYYRVLWLYDPDDLAAVVAGTKQPYEPQPYMAFNIEKYMFYHGRAPSPHMGGITYDSTNQKIYVLEPMIDSTNGGDPRPIVHVFQLSDSGMAADTLAPTAVTSVSHDGAGHLTWTASTDNDEVGGYIVNRNGKPIAFTYTNSWNDDVYNRFIGTPNHTYTVEAVDQANNSIPRGQSPWTSAGRRFKNFKIAENP